MKRLQELLKEKRVESGFTQESLGEAMGYSSGQFISRWERGDVSPPLESLDLLCGLIGAKKYDVLTLMVETYKNRLQSYLWPSTY